MVPICAPACLAVFVDVRIPERIYLIRVKRETSATALAELGLLSLIEVANSEPTAGPQFVDTLPDRHIIENKRSEIDFSS
jgi:hypothetical protein